jgi:hypothetical protein
VRREVCTSTIKQGITGQFQNAQIYCSRLAGHPAAKHYPRSRHRQKKQASSLLAKIAKTANLVLLYIPQVTALSHFAFSDLTGHTAAWYPQIAQS